MKVSIYNSMSYTFEYFECDYVKIDKERILLVGSKTISILKKDKDVSEGYKHKIRNSFLENKPLNITINKESIAIE